MTAFGSVLHTERNEAVKSWDNGRFWLGIIACFDNYKISRYLGLYIGAIFEAAVFVGITMSIIYTELNAAVIP